MPGTSIGGNSPRRARIHSLHEGTLVEPEEEVKEIEEAEEVDISSKTVPELREELEEHGVDPDELEGSGADGNVVKADLVAALEGLEGEDEGEGEKIEVPTGKEEKKSFFDSPSS